MRNIIDIDTTNSNCNGVQNFNSGNTFEVAFTFGQEYSDLQITVVNVNGISTVINCSDVPKYYVKELGIQYLTAGAGTITISVLGNSYTVVVNGSFTANDNIYISKTATGFIAQNIVEHSNTEIDINNSNRVLISDSSMNVTDSEITTTELNCLENVSGNIQSSINTINGNIATMAGDITELQTPKEVVLWTNPNPNSGFQPQTIAVNLSGYDYVSILATFTNTANDFSNITTTKVGNKGVISITMTSPDSTASAASFSNGAYRKFQTSTTGITFENGQMTYAGNAYENWAGRAVPQQIIGKKLN